MWVTTMAWSMADNGVVNGEGRQHGQQCGPKHGDETMGGGPAGCSLRVHCASAVGGEGTYRPVAASATIHDHHVPWAAGTHPQDGIDGSMAQQA
jgi:hypothetical protein